MNFRQLFLIGRAAIFATLLTSAGVTSITVANGVDTDQQIGQGNLNVAVNVTSMPPIADPLSTIL
jgi:hypothetical protein